MLVESTVLIPLLYVPGIAFVQIGPFSEDQRIFSLSSAFSLRAEKQGRESRYRSLAKSPPPLPKQVPISPFVPPHAAAERQRRRGSIAQSPSRTTPASPIQP